MARVSAKVVAAGALLTALAAGLAACGDDGGGGTPADAPAAPAGDAVLGRGRELYVSYCGECHGMTGAGRAGGSVAPALRDVADRLTLEQHLQIVRQGKGLMPAWQSTLDPDEIEAVVRYEREVL